MPPLEALASVNLSLALDAVHRAVRVIRFRDGAEHMLAYMRHDADDEGARLALQILDTIAAERGHPISAMSEHEAGRSIERLSDFVQQRVKAEWKYDEARGDRALRELRADAL